MKPTRTILLLFFVSASADLYAVGRDGQTVYSEVCAACHDAGGPRTPARSAIEKLSAARIVNSLESGTMRIVGNFSLVGSERIAVAEYLSGEIFNPNWADSGENQCPQSNWPSGDPLSKPHWNGWGNGLTNSRTQSTEFAGIDADNVSSLRLAWVFAFPGETFVESQPTVVGGRLFMGSPSGLVYALDAKTGCTIWTFKADGPVKGPVTIAKLKSGKLSALFGDQTGRVYSINADDGTPRWKQVGDTHPSARVTGGVQTYAGKVYVPMASLEEANAMDPNYKCCVFRGSVIAYDIENGALVWKQHTIEQEANIPSKDSHGKEMVGPSGASAWSAVTIDVKRNRIYVGTGDNYSNPATNTSDSVLALNLDTGKIEWHYQGLAGDAWNVGCMSVPKINCPAGEGPDEDMGSSPILVTTENGKDILLATQKSGVAHAIDPDNDGALIWKKKFAKGGIQGGFQWGQTSNGRVLYGAKSDTEWLTESSFDVDAVFDSTKGGGLVAVDVATGNLLWETEPVDCGDRHRCSPSQSAAVSLIGNVVFTGAQSGEMLAFHAQSGKELWRYDSVREYDTVNGAKGRGGAIDQAGAVSVDGMLYFNSGYSKFSGVLGNVLLAFKVGD
ncbi:MAG: outer membrane protein assembly factor BamB family protein [Gammaproteobacteria bacterium]